MYFEQTPSIIDSSPPTELDGAESELEHESHLSVETNPDHDDERLSRHLQPLGPGARLAQAGDWSTVMGRGVGGRESASALVSHSSLNSSLMLAEEEVSLIHNCNGTIR